MKYLNKKKIENLKKNKNNFSKKYLKFLLIILIFFMGIWSERFDVVLQFKNFAREVTDTAASRIYSAFNKETDKLIIDIRYKNYMEILSSREESIKSLRATEDIHDWVPAKMLFGKEKYNIRIKLKGVHSEHWKHPNKWSFKIKLLDEKSIDGVRRFSIQQPKTRDFLYEWLFMKVLEKEKLISHRTKYLETVVNGNSLGIYFFEEQHSKELIENNKRREGPIIGLDKNLWIKEVNNMENLTINVLEDTFWRAKIKPVQFNDEKIGSEQEIFLKKAINLFENFRKSKSSLEETFDVNQLAKLMAIKAIFGAVEFDWRDLKFYYNPITSLLEPIGREVHISKNFNEKNTWWVDSNEDGFLHSLDQKNFIDLLYKDLEFYNLYLSELDRISNEFYIQRIIEENKKEFLRYKKILKSNFPLEEIFSEEHFIRVREIIRQTLNPIQGINAYFVDYDKKGNLLISIQNTQRLPVQIKAIKFKDNQKLLLKRPVVVNGKKNKKPLDNSLITFNCLEINNNEVNCKNHLIFRNNQTSLSKENKIIFNILGQKKDIESEILRFYETDEPNTKKNKILSLDELQKIPYLKINQNEKSITFLSEKINIDKKLILPKGFVVNFIPGSNIIFSEKGQIISYSPLKIIGEIDNPIIFQNKTKNYGNGLAVIEAKSKSVIKNAIFRGLSSPEVETGEGLLGAINFFRSDVDIENAKFEENLGEDFLNIISSNFSIKNISMRKINYDAIDFDFSNGFLENISIFNSGNDALDFSGSDVKGKNIFINEAGDKGISVGEKSNISFEDIKLSNTNIALATKDLSKLQVTNAVISKSNVAVAAYQKKPEYGPGFASIENILVENSKNKYVALNQSKIQIDGKILEQSKIDLAEYLN